MSFRDCIKTLVDGGLMSAARGDEINAVYSKEYGQTRDHTAAKSAVIAYLERESIHKKRVGLLQQQANDKVEGILRGHRTADGQGDVAGGLVEIMRRLDYERQAITGLAHAQLGELFNAFGRGILLGDFSRTLRPGQRARMHNVVKELFGEASNDATAKKIAGAWSKVSEDLRQRFNAAGGAIGKLANWGLPQHHNARALIEAGFDKWSKYILDRLAPDKMMHPILGRPMTKVEVQESLQPIYNAITSGGLWDEKPSAAVRGPGALHKRHADHRFLVFKDAKAFLEYQEHFGTRDPFAVMMGHINTMARDIAAMETLGPNPNTALNYARSIVDVEKGKALMGVASAVPKTSDPQSHANTMTERAGAMWDLYRGATESPVGNTMAVFFSNARNLVTASTLGGAMISAISDVASQTTARRFVGLTKSSTWQVLGSTFDNFRKLSADDAVAAGLGLDSAAHALSMQARYLGAMDGSTWSRFLADRVMTWQLLSPWTQAARHGFGTDFMREMGRYVYMDYSGARLLRQNPARLESLIDQALAKVWTGRPAAQANAMRGRLATVKSKPELLRSDDIDILAEVLGRAALYDAPVKELPDGFRRALARNGITEDDWGLIQQASAASFIMDPGERGLTLKPQHIAAVNDPRASEVAKKYLAMILREMEFAVPNGTLESKAIMVGKTKPGTVQGEIMRTMGQFKSFGVTVILLHARRVAQEYMAGRGATAAGYAAQLLITGTILGALAIQLKQLAAGKDPQRMDDPKLWGAALLQGGGLGIYGDFLFAELNRFGGGFASTIGGPLTGRASNLWNLTGGNVVQYAQGEKTNFGKELSTFLRSNTPGGNLWYLRLAMERKVFDQIQWNLDPEAHQAFRRRVANAQRDKQQDFWWAPGEASPRRGPALERALGR